MQTTRLKDLEDFYGSLLGLPVKDTGKELLIRAGHSRLLFQPVNTGDPVYHFAFNIPCNKIKEAAAWLKEKVELIWLADSKTELADFVSWHAKSVYFFDPAGNIAELIARFDLDNAADQPFSAEQILSVSEIGLVFPADELEQRAKQCLQDYGLTYFDKQPPLPQFKAIGDDEGLFIMVPEHRNWYPTSVASGIFPLHIRFEQGNSFDWQTGN